MEKGCRRTPQSLHTDLASISNYARATVADLIHIYIYTSAATNKKPCGYCQSNRIFVTYPPNISTATAKPMAKGVNTESLFRLSRAFIKTVKTKTKVRTDSHKIAQPGSTSFESVWAPPEISL